MVAEAQQRSTQSRVDIHLLGPRHLDSWLHCKGTIPGGLYISPGELVSPQTVTLLANLGHLGSQEDVGRDWWVDHSFATDVVSRAEIAVGPCLLPLTITCLPLCLHGCRWEQLATLQYLLGCYPLFCECAWCPSVAGMVLCFSGGPTIFPSVCTVT